MLPKSKTPRHAAPEARKGKIPSGALGGAPQGLEQPHGMPAGGEEPLVPIGPERLKALRKAIREGTYPTDADVLGGLQRLLRNGA